jgi:predicted AAA+ superfamily ATPase
MGRYFNYRLHPLSVAELIRSDFNTDKLIQSPQNLENDRYAHLFQFGGFPEPFLKANPSFFHRWQRLRQQLVREEIRDVAKIQEIAQLEMLVVLLQKQAGQVTTYATLAKQLRVSVDTVRRWLDVLEGFYYCFLFALGIKISRRRYEKNLKLIYGIGPVFLIEGRNRRILSLRTY